MYPIPGYTPSGDRAAYIRSIPAQFLDDICTGQNCPNYGEKGFTRVPEKGQFWVHAACMKPRDLWHYIEECINCEEYYLVEYMPDTMMLCPGCKAAND